MATTTTAVRDGQFALEVKREKNGFRIWDALLRVVRVTKKPPLAIMRDYVRLAIAPGRLTFKDYMDFRIFDEKFWDATERRSIVGRKRGLLLTETANHRTDLYGLLENKIASSAYLEAHGLPVIPLKALFVDGLNSEGKSILSGPTALYAFLAEARNYPLFGKPADGVQSLGSIALRRVLPDSNSIELATGHTIPTRDLVSQIQANYPNGYIFQPMLAPHPAIQSICGTRLATIRAITLTDGDNARLFRACWKIPAGRNFADNYWRNGNLIAQLDLPTGKVLRALSGMGLSLSNYERHPDSNAAIVGFEIPHWTKIVNTVLKAARVMRNMAVIGWDVAVLEDGPVIVEMNASPDFGITQLADGRGILDDEFMICVRNQKRAASTKQRENAQVLSRL